MPEFRNPYPSMPGSKWGEALGRGIEKASDTIMEYQKFKANRQKEKQKSEFDSLGRATVLRKEFMGSPVVKNFGTIARSFKTMKEGYLEAQEILKGGGDEKSLVAADQALIVTLNKALDPGSVVRESEYARTPEGIGLIKQLQGRLEKVGKGGAGITNSDRKAIFDMGTRLIKAAQSDYKLQRSNYGSLASEYKVNSNLVLGNDLSLTDDDFSLEEKKESIKGSVQPSSNLPYGVTELDIRKTMEEESMTRKQVIDYLNTPENEREEYLKSIGK